MDTPSVLLWSESGKAPEYATVGSSGFDICAHFKPPLGNMVLDQGRIQLVPTGLKMAIPEGYEVQIRSRSGLCLKHGVIVANSPGTIDRDYRGEVGILMLNLYATPFVIENGMKIAQGVLAPVSRANFQLVSSLDETQRGGGGFGSTGL